MSAKRSHIPSTKCLGERMDSKTEAATKGVPVNKVLLEISQNS